MNFVEVSPYGIVGRDWNSLTYETRDILPVGTVVEIPIGRRKSVGVVIKHVEQPNFACKGIIRTINEIPLPNYILKLHTWMSEYYATHPGIVWQSILPSGISKNRRGKKNPENLKKSEDEARTNIVYTNDQQNAISQILKMPSGTALLHGKTGSGKTEVYKALAMEAATRGKSSIILIPEISLTTQLVNQFRRDFQNIIVTHSTMTESERHLAWLAALQADQATIVIGPRSALFMPLKNLGLIVIDECHEPSYKQEKSPRYDTLRAASIVAQTTKSRLILGSATPSITDYYTAKKLQRPIVEMTEMAHKQALAPTTKIIDLTKHSNRSNKSKIFSKQLINEMQNTLSNHEQILLFHNRRGTAPITLCEECAWTAICPRCFVPLTLHADHFTLRCHICGYHEKPPTTCPNCHNAEISHRGIGTKMIESEAQKLFPNAKIRRFDGDNNKGEQLHDVYDELHAGKIDIIIGTQAVAKGLDLPNLALVGIVQADAGLMLPDFSANERGFQLIAQAVGRVGRDHKASKVIVQTYQPDHPAVVFGSEQNYSAFYKYEILNRQRGNFPPFSHLLRITNSYKSENSAINSASKLANEIRQKYADKVKILGPAPAFYERQRDNFRWQIVVCAKNRADLIEISKLIPAQHWQSELDPRSLI